MSLSLTAHAQLLYYDLLYAPTPAAEPPAPPQGGAGIPDPNPAVTTLPGDGGTQVGTLFSLIQIIAGIVCVLALIACFIMNMISNNRNNGSGGGWGRVGEILGALIGVNIAIGVVRLIAA